MFVVHVPVNDSIEGATGGIATVYSGVALFFGGLIAFKLGWQSFPFSVNAVLRETMNDMKSNPFNFNDKKWKNNSDKERMSKVVSNLIKHGKVYSHLAIHDAGGPDEVVVNAPPPPPQSQAGQVAPWTGHITRNGTTFLGVVDNATNQLANWPVRCPFNFRTNPTIITGFNKPRAITVMQGGDVFVLERDRRCVSRIIANGQTRRVQLPHGNVCQLQWPTGIAAYKQQLQGGRYIFVVDRRNNSVEKFQLNENNLTYCGTTQADVHAQGVQNGAGGVFKKPVGIAVHPTTRRVYVADTGNHRIVILDENLNFIGKFGRRGNGNYQFKQPQDITFVMDGNYVTMYVADHGNNRIQVFRANDIVYSGLDEEHIEAQTQVEAGEFTFAIEGNSISKSAQNGGDPIIVPANGAAAGGGNLQFRDPAAIAVHPVTGRVYVADTGNHRIKVLNDNLVFVRHLPANGVAAGIGNDQFNSPQAIAINPVTGRVYVADTDNNRIKVLDDNLNFVRHFGANNGNENNLFTQPCGISFVNGANNVQMRVTDRNHDNQPRTQVFTDDDNVYSRTIGNEQRQVRKPNSVAVEHHLQRNAVYISEDGKDHVSKYSIDGTFLGLFGPLPFRNPHGIAVDDTGTVYVCDTGNNRVQIFEA